MSWYRHKLERDLQRWQAAGWVTPGGAGAIRNDLEQRRAALTAAPVLAVLGAGPVRLCGHEFRGGALDGNVETCPSRLAGRHSVGLLRRRRAAVSAPAPRLCARRRAGRHCRLGCQHHADRPDVPHGGQSARRPLAMDGRCVAGRRAGPLRGGPGCDLRALERLVRLGAPLERDGALVVSDPVERCGC